MSYSKLPECDVTIRSENSMFTRFAVNGITTSGSTLVHSMSITSSKDGRSGSTRLAEFDDAAIRNAVNLTEQLATIAPPNPEQPAPLGPQKYQDAERYAPAPADRHAAMIAPIRDIVNGAKKNKLVSAGYIQRIDRTSAIGNKAGVAGYARTCEASLSTTVRTPDGSSSGWASQIALRIEDLKGAEAGRIATEKCLGWRNPKRMEPGKYTVVLEPEATANLVGALTFHLNARAAEEGRSFLSRKDGGTRLGEKLFAEWITLRTDPLHPLFSALPWSDPSDEGPLPSTGGGLWTPARPISWIENGIVRNLVYDRYWSAKSDRPVTPAPRNVVLEGSGKSTADLVSTVERGLLVTRFFYVRFLNPQTVQLTGLTRDGLFLIEDGKITAPAVNFRFNESVVRLLQNTVAIGAAERTGTGPRAMVVPSVVARDFTFTSISDAI
jgi:predicted Zn-dependent protease